jgi:hypothetical protein
MKPTISATLMQEEANAWKSNTVKMKKVKLFWSSVEARRHNRDGTSFILTRQRKFNQRESTRTTDSISTDHSISDQDFQ